MDDLEDRVTAIEATLMNLRAEIVMMGSRTRTSDASLETLFRRLLDKMASALRDFSPKSQR